MVHGQTVSKKRWFELRGCELAYFLEPGGAFKGLIDVSHAECKQIRPSTSLGASQFEIEIEFTDRLYRLETPTANARRAWVQALQDARIPNRSKLTVQEEQEAKESTAGLESGQWLEGGSGAKSLLKSAVRATIVSNRVVDAVTSSAAMSVDTSGKWTRPDFDGWMTKQGSVNKNWKKRWFELRGPYLSWFVEAAGEQKGELNLQDSSVLQIRISENQDAQRASKYYELEVVCSERTYRLACEDANTRREWLQEMHRAKVGDQKVRNSDDPGSGLSAMTMGLDAGESNLFVDQQSERTVYSQSLEASYGSSPDHSGWLSKKGKLNKSWKRRWFVLQGARLAYYDSPSTEKKGEILLCNAGCQIEVSEGLTFEVVTQGACQCHACSNDVASRRDRLCFCVSPYFFT